MQVFAIYDVQTEVWSVPMTAVNRADFVRNLSAQLSTADVNTSMMARHPEDFELWHIGEYEDGQIKPVARDMISRLSSFVRRQNAAASSDRQPG